jgi:RNAse (barnase) inhibitor barstar
MTTVRINGDAIKDWTSFHAECKNAFGFPDFYGNTMDAWVDCLSYLRDEDGMSSIHLQPEETLQIELINADAMRKRAPEILEEMGFCIEGINERYEDYGEKPALVLVLR